MQKKVNQYVNLGNTGLKVSRFALGNWINSDLPDNQEITTKLVKTAWELGINYFDTAEEYGAGEAERQMGIALQSLNVPRNSYVLSTKIFWGPNSYSNPNDVGLSRKHIIEGLKNSLQRLNQSYVDVVFAHRFDSQTPLEETCRAFDWVVRQGWANYWATSEWNSSEIFEAFSICKQNNLVLPIADQCEYNMLERQKVDKDFGRLFDHYKYGTTVYSPLAGGLLTGKYNDGLPEDSRYKKFEWDFEEKIQQIEDKKSCLKQLGEIAKKLNITQAQLALAWILYNKDVSVAILGATKPEQLKANVEALEHVQKLTPEVLNEIEKVLNNRPKPDRDPRTWKPYPDRR
ncbi:NADP-dependent oxidoreductase domain [Pseudocohnilembus persalinus]|uniref:NADP-dependent oxidoreductase domain n=1 Tax=Pseudocohnilembus persalinus TaxID=266149 RepID=A0A0V0R3H9_PSEPJ|nr:NADP-dependent oxidoreductase domain [Pseudocohnilembus persalinus]|eukprot:KRX09062.1 NADP-dependent oxidoreductase domain [Pseudocohnilembus persalinus]